MILSGIGLVLLPNADLNDEQLLDVSVTSMRAMDGTRQTHKKSSNRRMYTYTFSNLPRHLMFELQAFIKVNKAEPIAMVDWTGTTVRGIFDVSSTNFDASSRATNATLRNETGSVTLVIIGT